LSAFSGNSVSWRFVNADLTNSFATQTVARRPSHFTERETSPNLLRKIIEDIRLTPEAFLKLL
jgi:hypothetical protein